MKTVLLAHKDVRIVKSIVAVLKDEHGLGEVKVVSEGAAAWEALKAGGIDYLVMDWDLEKLASPTLFNRLRQDDRYENLPVMVISKSSNKERFTVIKDYPPTGISDGNFDTKSFSLKFGVLMKDADWYRKDHPFLGPIVKEFRKDAKKTQTDLAALAKAAPNTQMVLNIAAKRFFEAELFNDADRILAEALKINSSNRISLLMSAKICHISGRRQQALNVLSENKFSIKDMGYLMLMGELQLSGKKIPEARKLFGDVLSLDPDFEKAKLGVFISDQMKNFLEKQSEKAAGQSFNTVLSLTANWLMDEKQHDQAIKVYEAALPFVYESLVQARIMCDLGQTYLALGKRKEALEWFKKAVERSNDRFPEAADQVKKLSQPAAA